MHTQSQAMRDCILNCLDCHRTCLGMAASHCLEAGGRYVEPRHFRLMLSCAEICRTAADLMLIGTDHHRRVCASCAEICTDCAASCREVGGMEECVQACERCAESCRAMAG